MKWNNARVFVWTLFIFAYNWIIYQIIYNPEMTDFKSPINSWPMLWVPFMIVNIFGLIFCINCVAEHWDDI